MSYQWGSDEDESDREDSSVQSLEGTNDGSSSSEKESSVAFSAEGNDIEYAHKVDVLLNIHDQLDLDKLQKMKRYFIADDDTPGTYAELDMEKFSDALRSVLPDMEDLTDEDLRLLFMKIDADGSGEIDWDEFTGFLLQLDEGNRNMAAAAQMSDLKPLPATQRAGGEHMGQHRDMVEKVINVERPGISAYVSCARDGTIKFWHKATFAPYRTIRHLDAMKTAYEVIIMGAKGRQVNADGRRICSAPVNRAVKSMKSAWVYDIQQMPLSNMLAAACFDRTVSFYDMLTGEFFCRIGGLRSSPTCVDCVEIGTNEQQVLFGDLDGVLHVWSFGKHFYIPGLHDTHEAAEINGSYSLPLHSGAVTCLGYVPDLNAAVTCGMDGKIIFFDLAKRRVTRTFGGHLERPVFTFAYSERHRFVASAGMGRAVVFWNSYTMNVLARRDGHAANVRHCIVDDRSDRVITISADKAVRCWDSATFRCIQSFKDHRMHRPDDTITAALWDHSRSSLIIAGSRLGVWKNKGAIHSSKHSHEAPVTGALYNSHFHQVVSGDAMGNVHVWLVESGLLAFRFGKAHGASKLSCLAFDASERRLLTGANDGTVKMWNFNNGKELRLLRSTGITGREAAQNNEGNERNEVSGIVWCRDAKGPETESPDYVATCSWDQQVRIFPMDPGHHHRQQSQHPKQPASGRAGGGGEVTPVTVASRVFPGKDRLLQQQRHHDGVGRKKGVRMDTGGDSKHVGGGGDEVGSGGQPGASHPIRGHSADVLAIAHCGDQQVATAGFDGQIFIWATESGKVNFSMKPSDHDVSKLDEVSSIGGLTSVARLMLRERRKRGGILQSDSVDSGGYLDRMNNLLAEDASISHLSWDGREYFAEERMGGSDDGTGTGQAADAAADHDPEDESVADGSDPAGAKTAAAAAAAAGAKAPAPEMPVISEGDVKPGDKSASTEGAGGEASEAGSPRRKGGALSSPDQAAAEPAPNAEVATTPDARSPLAAQTVPSPLGGPAAGGFDGAVATANRAPVAAGVPPVGGASAKREQASKKAAAVKQEKGGVEELLESTVSHTVDCLIYVRCHGVLCSGSASGELHLWDASSGAFIFGVAARHPNNSGLTALSSNEASLEGGSRGVLLDFSKGIGGGNVGGGGGGGPATTTAAVAAGGGGMAGSCADLMLYTACEEGFVKTWKVGDITEHAYQTGLRARPKPPRKTRAGRGGKEPAAGEPAEPALSSPAAPAMPQISLLQPAHQWQAHKTAVTSVDGGSFRGKLDLLITAGDDCYVHVWTVAGAHVGTFGQPTAWSLASRATWREPADQGLCNADGSRAVEEEDEQLSSATSEIVTNTTDITDTNTEQESKETAMGGNKHVHGKPSKSGTAASAAESSREEKEPRKGRKQEERRGRVPQDRDPEKERQETERYQEQRYYIASQNRVQRKLLRGRLSAFCASRDCYKKENIQEVSQVLRETGAKTSRHAQPSSTRPGLSKHRITSILRNTYNQVSFQLQLHKHEDVHERAEAALTRRKSRRRGKASGNSNAATNNHQHRHSNGTPGTNRSSSLTTPAGTATPRTVSRATGVEEDGGSGVANPGEDENPTDGNSHDGGNGGGGGGGGSGAPLAGGEEAASKDRDGGARPAVPIDPRSSSATSGSRFRRTSMAAG